MMTIEEAGPLTTLQDPGRPGSAHLGIGRSGAADLPAMRLANALVGNRQDACVLEMTLAGASVAFRCPVTVAITGAVLPRAEVDGTPLPMWQSFPIPAGARLALGPMSRGCRSYLAVGGGIDVPSWRGSRCTDVNAGLGPCPRALEAGDTLALGTPRMPASVQAPAWSLDPEPWFDDTSPRSIRLLPGSHTEALDADSRDALTTGEFTLGNDSNRVGMRLDGPTLKLGEPLELISEGIVPGVMQLPPDGRPIIMGCEHPVTGGYPRIGQVAAVDLPVLAQCRPGDTLHFAWVEPARAMQLLAERESGLEQLVSRIGKRLEQP